MLPPARKAQLATNEDFRKLLETPRAQRGGEDETPARQPRRSSDAKPKSKRPPRPKPESEKQEQEGDGYRQAYRTDPPSNPISIMQNPLL